MFHNDLRGIFIENHKKNNKNFKINVDFRDSIISLAEKYSIDVSNINFDNANVFSAYNYISNLEGHSDSIYRGGQLVVDDGVSGLFNERKIEEATHRLGLINDIILDEFDLFARLYFDTPNMILKYILSLTFDKDDELSTIRTNIFKYINLIKRSSDLIIVPHGVSTGKSHSIPAKYLQIYSNDENMHPMTNPDISEEVQVVHRNLLWTSILKKQNKEQLPLAYMAFLNNVPCLYWRSQEDTLPIFGIDDDNPFDIEKHLKMTNDIRSNKMKYMDNVIKSFENLGLCKENPDFEHMVKKFRQKTKYLSGVRSLTTGQKANLDIQKNVDEWNKIKITLLNLVARTYGDNIGFLLRMGYKQYRKQMVLSLKRKEHINSEEKNARALYYIYECFMPFEIAKYMNCIIVCTTDKMMTNILYDTQKETIKDDRIIRLSNSYYYNLLGGVETKIIKMTEDKKEWLKSGFLTPGENFFVDNNIGFILAEDEEHDAILRKTSLSDSNEEYAMDRFIKVISGKKINFLHCLDSIDSFYYTHCLKDEGQQEDNPQTLNTWARNLLVETVFSKMEKIGFSRDDILFFLEQNKNNENKLMVHRQNKDTIINIFNDTYALSPKMIHSSLLKNIEIFFSKRSDSVLIRGISQEKEEIIRKNKQGGLMSLYGLISLYICLLSAISDLDQEIFKSSPDGKEKSIWDAFRKELEDTMTNKHDSLYHLISSRYEYMDSAKSMYMFLVDDGEIEDKRDWYTLNFTKKFAFVANAIDLESDKDNVEIRINMNITSVTPEVKILQFLRNPNNQVLVMSGTRSNNCIKATFYDLNFFKTYNTIIDDHHINIIEPDELSEDAYEKFISKKLENKTISIGHKVSMYGEHTEDVLKEYKLYRPNNTLDTISHIYRKNELIWDVDYLQNRKDVDKKQKLNLFRFFKNSQNEIYKGGNLYKQEEATAINDSIYYSIFNNKNTFVISNSHDYMNFLRKDSLNESEQILDGFIMRLRKEDIKDKEESNINVFYLESRLKDSEKFSFRIKVVLCDKSISPHQLDEYLKISNADDMVENAVENIILVSSYGSSGTGLNLLIDVLNTKRDFDTIYLAILPYYSELIDGARSYNTLLGTYVANKKQANKTIACDDTDPNLLEWTESNFKTVHMEHMHLIIIKIMQAIGRIERRFEKQNITIICATEELFNTLCEKYYNLYHQARDVDGSFDDIVKYSSLLNRAMFQLSNEMVGRRSMSRKERETLKNITEESFYNMENNMNSIFTQVMPEYRRSEPDFIQHSWFPAFNRIARNIFFDKNVLLKTKEAILNLANTQNMTLDDRNRLGDFARDLYLETKIDTKNLYVSIENKLTYVTDVGGFGNKILLSNYLNKINIVDIAESKELSFLKKIREQIENYNISGIIPNPALNAIVRGNIGEMIFKEFSIKNGIKFTEDYKNSIIELFDFYILLDNETLLAVDVKNWNRISSIQDPDRIKTSVLKKYAILQEEYPGLEIKTLYLNTSFPDDIRGQHFKRLFEQGANIEYMDMFEKKEHQDKFKKYSMIGVNPRLLIKLNSGY